MAATIAPKMPATDSELISMFPRRASGSTDLNQPMLICEAKFGPRLCAGPEIKRARLLLFISRAVGFPDQRKASGLVKAPSPVVALERPELQQTKSALG